MADTYYGTPALTAEQLAVVDQPARAKVLVTAAAGSGKTHTLVRRLDALIERHDLSAGEILVLTFSRAAVRELSTRLVRQSEAARHVRARTFDSWALDLLSRFGGAGDWHRRSFDERIEAAAALIERGDVDELYETDLVHVVIDEVQDLVGARRVLVETLLDRYDCGFTVVGDVAQAIYGWQVDDPKERAEEPGRFLRWVRKTFAEELVELGLNRNFRARTPEAAMALGTGSLLRDQTTIGAEPTEFASLRRRLRIDLFDTLDFGDLGKKYVRDALRTFEGTCALLCRTNGQALLISEVLHEGGVPHRLQTSARDRSNPAWLAGLFPLNASPVLTYSELEELMPSSEHTGGLDLDTVWRCLLRSGGTSAGHAVDRSRLRLAMSAARLADEIGTPLPARLIVSSIHRAKGLEFDRVIVVEPEPALREDTDIAEEARTLYVAMTRARDDLMRISAPDTKFVRKHRSVDRWGRFRPSGARIGMEVRAGDVDQLRPPGTFGFTADPLELQDYIDLKVDIGDAIRLKRNDDVPVAGGEAPEYLIQHGKVPIGVVSSQFRQALRQALRRSHGKPTDFWPREITTARVASIETVTGSEAAGKTAGLGDYGIWVVPRLSGLTRFIYEWHENEGPDFA